MKILTGFFFLLLPAFCLAQKPQLVIPAGHTDAITCMAISKDGAYVLTGSQDKKAKLWNADEQLLRTFEGHPAGLIEVAFSSQNNYVVTRCDSLSKVWTLTGELQWAIPTPSMYPKIQKSTYRPEQYDPALFSPDERYVFLRNSDSTLLAHDLLTEAQRSLRSTHRKNVQFSPDGTYLLVQQDSELVLFDRQMQEAHRFTVAEPNGSVAFIDNDQIAVGYLYSYPEDAGGGIILYQLDGTEVQKLGTRNGRWLNRGITISVDTSYITNSDGSVSQLILEAEELIPRVFTKKFADDPFYDSYWDVMRFFENDSSLYLANEARYEIWNLKTGQRKDAGPWPASPEYPIFLSDTKWPTLFRKPENDTLFLLDDKGDVLAETPDLFKPRRLYGRRTMTWPQPVAIFPKADQLLLGDRRGAIHRYDFKGRYLGLFGNNMLGNIQRIRSYTNPDEWQMFFGTNEEQDSVTKTIYNWRLGTIQQKAFLERERRPDQPYINTIQSKQFLDPEDVHQSDKHFLSNNKELLVSGHEDFMMHVPHGAMMPSMYGGMISIQDFEKQENFFFQSGLSSISDVILTSDNQYLLASSSSWAKEAESSINIWDLPALRSDFQANWQVEQGEATEASFQVFSQQFDAKPYLRKRLTNFPTRTLLLSGGKQDFLYTGITDWQSGRPFMLDVDHNFYRADLEGNLLGTYRGHERELLGAEFFLNDQFIVSWSKNQVAKVWNTESMQELATIYFFDTSDWVLRTKNGLFDGSPGGLKQLYYVIDTEIIELDQLKARYYEPGLLQKLLGYSDEPIRPVEDLEDLKLFPKIEAKIIDHSLNVKLIPRNGGIGKVSIFINGKEVIEEANPLPRQENAKRDSIIHFDLQAQRKYFLTDSVNIISIRAYNAEGWLKSPEYQMEYTPPPLSNAKGKDNSEGGAAWKGTLDPKLFVVSIGTSDYSGTQLDLQYADQDAAMMAKALNAVGAALFSNDDSQEVEVHCFSTTNKDSTGLENTAIHWQFASKNNIEATFQAIKNEAKAEDVVVVYLSGHGVTYGSSGEAQFHYLTQGIASEDLSDLAIRQAYTISSGELTNWINDIPALKQVLIIDACNSGQIVENLTSGSKSLNSSQVRALDRMKDRTGMFVLSGSASDKVSYEASEYGQGLLTYALLQGMLGVATRKDTKGQETIDVIKLFQYARDQVPILANSINGIQTPMLGFPNQAASFDIGILDEKAKQSIPIGNKKPVLVKSLFMDKNTFQDDLKLAEHLEVTFRIETEKGSSADLIYVDVYNYPNAFSVSGLYEKTVDGIKIEVKLFKDRKPIADLDISPSDDPKRLARNIARAVKKELEEWGAN